MTQAREQQVESPIEQVGGMDVAPRPEHRWLQRLVGDWTFETVERGGTGTPWKAVGTERVRTVGDIWIVAEGQGGMPDGADALTMMTLGYDPALRRVTGTWLGSMMTHLWVYDGRLDLDANVLHLEADGPSMKGDGTTARYRDTIALKHDNERTLTAAERQPDGSWREFMQTTYWRAGSKP